MDPDEALAAARAGDPDGIAALYRTLAAPLLSFLRAQTSSAQDAEDALGETFIAVIRDLGSFAGDFAAFKGWIYRIASNRAIDLARRGKRRREQPIEGMDPVPAADDPEEDAAVAAERALVWRAVRSLPELQRIVVTLRLAADLSNAEIAEVLGRKANAVKALQHRAMKGLAKALAAYPDIPPGRLGERRNDADEPRAP